MEAGDDAEEQNGGSEHSADGAGTVDQAAEEPTAGGGGDAASSLQSYREQVVEELERRVLRVVELERAVAAVHHQLDEVQHGRRSCAGETSTVVVRAAYTARLKRQLEAVRREQHEAQQDVRRAEERLQEVNAQLEELALGVGPHHTAGAVSPQVEPDEPPSGE